ncbi:endonuclease V [Polaribacter batillariae]|uniref:Endonuclease V n=1 Tax=Polaribacter batillariae TaxID=2808900 RepID=A0ABX7T1Q5_9FLAO|nr:endonuclease V [Polaribacter batillariae]
MILAIDVKYNEVVGTAKAVGVLCNWEDEEPKEIIIEYIEDVKPYVSGQFYKRELPSILKIVEKIDIREIEVIIIDGHIYVDNDKKFGLGGYVWQALKEKVPIIGVAKRGFYNNKETVIEILRGKSKTPLHISSVGIDNSIASKKIQSMKGEYRIPTILKTLDALTKKQNIPC